MIRRIYQQGDLLLEEVAKLPKRARRIADKLVIHGRTGNDHMMRVPEYSDGPNRYVVVKTRAVATHRQHGDLVVPAGVYLVRSPRDHRRPAYSD